MTANTPAQTGMDAGAVSREEVDWDSIDWNAAHQNVCRLQMRIVKATKEKKWGKVKALQRLLTRSFSGKALAVRRVTENQGRKTPGVDGEIWTMPSQKAKAVRDALGMGQMDPQWYRPSKMEDNPLAWMIMVDGFVVDVRRMSRAVQEVAYEKGLIPYIPGEK